jgi:hypothetical protein
MKIWGLCLVSNLLGIVLIAVLVWSCGMLSDAVVENLVHTVNDKTVRSGAWLIAGATQAYHTNPKSLETFSWTPVRLQQRTQMSGAALEVVCHRS